MVRAKSESRTSSVKSERSFFPNYIEVNMETQISLKSVFADARTVDDYFYLALSALAVG